MFFRTAPGNPCLSQFFKQFIKLKLPSRVELIFVLNVFNRDCLAEVFCPYGRTVEATVAEKVANSSFLSDYLEHVGGANNPDFRELGPLQGLLFDITTIGDAKSHLDRSWYGENLVVIPYTPPWQGGADWINAE
jgi:hypothetical protein